MLNSHIDLNEVVQQIRKLKTKKSPGLDRIPNEILKNDDVVYAIYVFLRHCFDNGQMPGLWLRAIICPIPKGAEKDPCCPISYRGISLLSSICKLYTGILNNRIAKYLESEQIICPEQFGFQKGKSCEDHVYNISTILRKRLQNNENTFAAFLDLEKAFDRIDRNLLFFKLLKYNIRGKIYNTIKLLYSATFNTIRINNFYTDWFPSTSGVRQGDTLSPTLFSIFINSLATELNELKLGLQVGNTHVSILLYADDMVLLSDSEAKLQSMLDHVAQWCSKWRIVVNDVKSGIVHFRKVGTDRSVFTFKLDGKLIETVKKYKYLGIILDEHLDFKECAKTLCEAGGRALSKIIGKFRNFKDLNYRTYTNLYNACVWPILNYCSSVWGFKNFGFAEKVQNRAIRFFLGLHRNAPVLALQGDMGWMLPKYKYYLSAVRLWNKICKMDQGHLTRKIFEWSYQNLNNNSWESSIYDLLDSINKLESFERAEEVDMEFLKTKLNDLMHSEWSQKLPSKPKLRTYSLFKSEVKTEDYVVSNIPKFKRSVLCQLRIGILPLEIETGRYTRKSLDERLCKLCKLNVEDEIHFLCVCPELQIIRDKYYSEVCSCQNDCILNQFYEIISSEKVKLLANFVSELWNFRNNILCN